MPGQAAKRKNPYAKSIEAYYQTLKDFAFQNALHEGAVSTAFQTLLGDAARSNHWTLIPQLSLVDVGQGIRPDGTLKDPMGRFAGIGKPRTPKTTSTRKSARKSRRGIPSATSSLKTRTAVLI